MGSEHTRARTIDRYVGSVEGERVNPLCCTRLLAHGQATGAVARAHFFQGEAAQRQGLGQVPDPAVPPAPHPSYTTAHAVDTKTPHHPTQNTINQ